MTLGDKVVVEERIAVESIPGAREVMNDECVDECRISGTLGVGVAIPRELMVGWVAASGAEEMPEVGVPNDEVASTPSGTVFAGFISPSTLLTGSTIGASEGSGRSTGGRPGGGEECSSSPPPGCDGVDECCCTFDGRRPLPVSSPGSRTEEGKKGCRISGAAGWAVTVTVSRETDDEGESEGGTLGVTSLGVISTSP